MAMTDQALQYYLHDEPDAFRLELSGSLSGEGCAVSIKPGVRRFRSSGEDRQTPPSLAPPSGANRRGLSPFPLPGGIRPGRTLSRTCRPAELFTSRRGFRIPAGVEPSHRRWQTRMGLAAKN